MTDLFISYAREDEARIAPLVAAFEQQGWSVFWDHRIPAGQTWRSYIGRNLNEARCVIAAWSQHSVGSKWVIEEADEGQKRDVLVPVLLDSVEPPIGFRSVQAADLTEWEPDQPSPHFQQLVQDIAAILKNTITATPRPPETLVEAAQTHKAPSPPAPRSAVSSSRHGTYALLVAILALIGVVGYWGQQWWFSRDPGQNGEQPQVPENGSQSAGVSGVRYFEGAWENVDQATRGITRLVIRTSDATVLVHAWGKCHPTDCDWGEVEADAYGEGVESNAETQTRSLGAFYKTDFNESTFTIHLENEGRLRLQTATRFTDNSGRSSYSAVYMLQRTR